MRAIRSAFATAAVAAALSAFSPLAAQAVTLPTDGSWSEFDFDQTGSALYDLSSLDTSFTFTLTGNSVLRVVDAGFSGDRFDLFVNGQHLGLTSAPTAQAAGANPVFDAAALWQDTHFSKGSWLLGAGTYTLTGHAVLSPYEGGFGYLSVTAVPEPETFALLLAGLGLVGVASRRRVTTQA